MNKEKAKEKITGFFKTCVPVWAGVCYCIAIFSLVIFIVVINSVTFADFFNENIAAYYRGFTASISGILNFSIAEAFIILLPFLIVMMIIYVIRLQKNGQDKKVVRFFVCIFALLSMFFVSFVFSHGSGYHGSTLDEKLEIEKDKVESSQLVLTTEYIVEKLNECADEVNFRLGSFSVMPYGFDEMVDKINDSYSSISKSYDFLIDFHSSIKPVMLSEVMSYGNLLGMYSYFSGESNININYPDYTQPFTCAHEMSHQRGISREDEANFMAFLVCINSDDVYIRYSGYLNMYEYLMSALYSADRTEYSRLYWSANDKTISEIQAFNSFYNKYQSTIISTVSEAVNNTYLQANGQSAGTRSYGMVVDLAVAYYKDSFEAVK